MAIPRCSRPEGYVSGASRSWPGGGGT
jgi:hypothetical protein